MQEVLELGSQEKEKLIKEIAQLKEEMSERI